VSRQANLAYLHAIFKRSPAGFSVLARALHLAAIGDRARFDVPVAGQSFAQQGLHSC
jgi:hypothetical protein